MRQPTLATDISFGEFNSQTRVESEEKLSSVGLSLSTWFREVNQEVAIFARGERYFPAPFGCPMKVAEATAHIALEIKF